MPKGIYKRTEEHKRKLSEAGLKRKALLGYINSPETRKKISEGLKGKKHLDETKRKISEANKGKHPSAEHKRKISETLKRLGIKPPSRKGYKHTEETKRKIGEVHKGEKNFFYGKHLSEETKEKLIKSHKGKHPSDEAKRKMSEAKKGKRPSEETKKKISGALKSKYRGEKSSNWQGGKSFEPYSPAWTSELKQAIRQRDNFTCRLCGKYPSFSVHHIDYDKKNCEPENLITLCISCHIKTNYNREYWIDYFVKIIKPSP